MTQVPHLEAYTQGPLPLTPDNFTPLARTPWGGTVLTSSIKKDICPDKIGQRVGESWDVSCDPSFPSKILGSSVTLSEMVQSYPHAMLSKNFTEAKGHTACEILVKLLNAAEDLSLQVHPFDDDVSLKKDECGKFESWYVLDAEAGAGIYLGFKKSLTQESLRKLLNDKVDLRPYLQFVPVKTGDYFEIPNGTCHAIGKGLTLLEVQHVLFGKKGKTYRLYDWGRTYNEKGEPDIHGKPRELHIEESLNFIQPEMQCGEDFLHKLRSQKNEQILDQDLHIQSFGDNPFYQCHRVSLKSGQLLTFHVENGYGAMIPLEGFFALRSHIGKDTYWQKGQSAFLPAASFPLRMESLSSDTVLFIVTPKGVKETWVKG